MPIITETYNEFHDRHGGDPVRAPSTRGLLFPDGALWADHGGAIEPSAEPVEALKAMRTYVAIKLDQAVSAFNYSKAECVQQQQWHINNPMSCPPAQANAEELLARDANRIADLREELADIDKLLANAPQAVARHENNDRGRERQAAAQLRFTKLSGISHDLERPQRPTRSMREPEQPLTAVEFKAAIQTAILTKLERQHPAIGKK